MHSSQNNPEKSYAEEKAKHIPSDCAWYLTCSFDSSNNKHSFFRGDDCNERLCENFEELVLEIINYEEKEIISLTNEETKSYEEQKVCHICRKEKNLLQIKMIKRHLKYIIKLGIVVIAQENLEATHGICNLKCKIPKEIPVVAHNASYDQRFITRQLAKKFKGQFECLGENSEKYITFSVLIKKELDNRKTIAHKLRFIDSSRFMPTSLSSLVDNVSEICSRKCKDKNCK